MDILAEFWKISFFVFLGLSGCVGLLALASPAGFSVLASVGNWTIFHGAPTRFDRTSFDIDKFATAHGRLFGGIVLFAAAYVWFTSRFGPNADPKSLLLVVAPVALILGIVVLYRKSRQSPEIGSPRTDALLGDDASSLVERSGSAL